MAGCLHRTLRVRTERDHCSWVQCSSCGKEGPAKHSYVLALLAWALHTVNMHPRNGSKRIARKRKPVKLSLNDTINAMVGGNMRAKSS